MREEEHGDQAEHGDHRAHADHLRADRLGEPLHEANPGEALTAIRFRRDGDLEPYLWLRHVLRALPTATTVEHFEALLPWNLKAEQLITA